MAKILCVCISKERKTCSQNIHECEADLQGLVGDVHYGMGGRKQVSLLPYEKVKEYFEQSEEEFRYGRFGENLLVEGIDWNSIAEEQISLWRCTSGSSQDRCWRSCIRCL